MSLGKVKHTLRFYYLQTRVILQKKCNITSEEV